MLWFSECIDYFLLVVILSDIVELMRKKFLHFD